ncbi:ERF family protein [Deinococcus sp.]|uniref:ERF family protein n=1 Tax=Deinococcus sp. TaxID=47478 RepID=UPI0025D850FD|nr:ERF family protein [Deinococcus sp.]
MKHSETLSALFAALSKAQAGIRPALKDAVNPHLKSKYADLGSVWEACRAPLAENGLSISQWPCEAPAGFMALTTVLAHSSGEYMMETYQMPLGKNDPQTAGSVLTYSKRYALTSVLGIVSGDDDDGHAASQPTRPAQARTQALQSPAPRAAGPAEPSEALSKLHGQIKRAGEKLSTQGHGDEARALLKGVAGWKTDEAQARAAYQALCDLGVSKATVSESETTVHRPALMGHARKAGADTSEARAAFWGYLLGTEAIGTKQLTDDQGQTLLDTLSGMDDHATQTALGEAVKA